MWRDRFEVAILLSLWRFESSHLTKSGLHVVCPANLADNGISLCFNEICVLYLQPRIVLMGPIYHVFQATKIGSLIIT